MADAGRSASRSGDKKKKGEGPVTPRPSREDTDHTAGDHDPDHRQKSKSKSKSIHRPGSKSSHLSSKHGQAKKVTSASVLSAGNKKGANKDKKTLSASTLENSDRKESEKEPTKDSEATTPSTESGPDATDKKAASASKQDIFSADNKRGGTKLSVSASQVDSQVSGHIDTIDFEKDDMPKLPKSTSLGPQSKPIELSNFHKKRIMTMPGIDDNERLKRETEEKKEDIVKSVSQSKGEAKNIVKSVSLSKGEAENIVKSVSQSKGEAEKPKPKAAEGGGVKRSRSVKKTVEIGKASAVLRDHKEPVKENEVAAEEDDSTCQTIQLVAIIVIGFLTIILLGVYLFAGAVKAVDIKTMEWQAATWNPGSCINILFAGRAGTGRHSLMQALLGGAPKCVSTKHASVAVCDIRVQATCFKVIVWTLPENAVGEYWRAVKDKLGILDLVVYTLRMDDFQLRPEDASNLYTLSKVFGNSIWRKGVFALTFANKVTYLDGRLQVRRGRDFLVHRRSHLKWKIHDVLVPSGISERVFKSMPFVPTGHRSEPLLLEGDAEPWINSFTKCAIVKMDSIGSLASGAMWRATKHRLELPPDSTVIKCHLLQY